jgi:hypothetical protein
LNPPPSCEGESKEGRGYTLTLLCQVKEGVGFEPPFLWKEKGVGAFYPPTPFLTCCRPTEGVLALLGLLPVLVIVRALVLVLDRLLALVHELALEPNAAVVLVLGSASRV